MNKNSIKISSLICISFVWVFASAATPLDSINYFEKENANPAIVYSLSSDYYPENRKIIIQTPVGYQQNLDIKYPVLYLLDGESKLKHVQFTVQLLASMRKIPELIIVALPAGETRQQDYTPNYLFEHSSKKLGDAENFTAFLKQELIPFVEKQFRTQPYKIVSGHSRSGLFVINDFINETKLFNAHFAFSPALWPNDFSIIDKATEKLKSKTQKGFLHISVGDEENEKMKASYQKLVSILESMNNNFNYQAQVVSDESHSTLPIIGHHIALQKLYTHWDQPWEQLEYHGLSVIKPQYELLSKEFAYKVIPDIRALNSIGYRYLKNKDITNAQKAFQMNTEYYPHSANAFDSLADGFEAQGNKKEARKSMKRALTLIKKEDANYQSIYQHWQRLNN